MKLPLAVTPKSSGTSLKADEKLHSLSQNQQSGSDSIVSSMLHCSDVDRSSARSTEVVRIP
jgi:hypothetical protein